MFFMFNAEETSSLRTITMKNEKLKELVDRLKKAGVNMSDDQISQLSQQVEKDFSYIPKIGVFGKTGAGKSSLVNAIFGQDVCPVSDVEACTREIQEANVGGIILVDCPGIAESKERDAEYHKLYSDLIPKLDAIIWVLQGDNRSYGPDIEFYDLLRECFKTKDGKDAPIYFALNQVDKIEPFREWNVDLCLPGSKQALNIQAKIDNVASIFHTAANMIIPVSATEKYNLSALITTLLNALPANQAIIASGKINETLEKRELEHKREIEELRKRNAQAAEQREKEHKKELEEIKKTQEKKMNEYSRSLGERIGADIREIGTYIEKVPIVGSIVGGTIKTAGVIIEKVSGFLKKLF